MSKPPKPTGLKKETPPLLKNPSSSVFTYEPEKEEPTLDETNPVAASFLHVFVMTLLGCLAFILGGGYLLVRSKGGGPFEVSLTLILTGGSIGVACFYKLCKSDKH